jgi:ribosomal protein L35AE/L33A
MARALAIVLAAALLQTPDVRVQFLDGGPVTVDPFEAPDGVKAIVFLFTTTDCPISNRYAPEVRRLAATFAPQGVLFKLVYANPAEDATAIRAHMTDFAYAGATQALRDPRHALVKYAGVTVTPEAAVYAGGRIVYRGRIDNRFVDLGVERPAATRRDLAEALTAVLAGKPVTPSTTQAVGCFIADFAR